MLYDENLFQYLPEQDGTNFEMSNQQNPDGESSEEGEIKDSVEINPEATAD